MKYIGVIGGAFCSKATEEIAYEVGSLIAKADCTLVCGGLSGVMEFAAKGAFDFGGMTIGILPGSSKKDANPYIKIAIATGIGESRNAVITSTCDAFIAVGGEYGTLSEIAFALRAGKKVIGIDTWKLERKGKPHNEIIEASNSTEAVKLASRDA